jgi:hypothetical protein
VGVFCISDISLEIGIDIPHSTHIVYVLIELNSMYEYSYIAIDVWCGFSDYVSSNHGYLIIMLMIFH